MSKGVKASLGQKMVLVMVSLLPIALLMACTSGGDAALGVETAVPAATMTLEDEETAAASLLSLPVLTGETLDLADFQGQVVLVNFWATWCAPCRSEMPELDNYLQAHRDDDFALLAVNAGESAARAAAYLAEFDYTFTIILDEEGTIDDYFGGVRGMPTSYVLNREGDVVYQHVGILTPEILEDQVTPLLSLARP